MKMHPFLKSVVVLAFLLWFLFFIEESIFKNNFDLFEIILSDLVFSFLLIIPFSVPFYFFEKLKERELVLLIIYGISFIMIFCLITIDTVYSNNYPFNLLQRYYRYFIDLIQHSFILEAIQNYLDIGMIRIIEYVPLLFLPIGLFLTTKLIINVNWKLLLLLLISFPVSLSLGNITKKVFDLFGEIPQFFILIFFINIVSNIYLIFFHKDLIKKENPNILDSPNL